MASLDLTGPVQTLSQAQYTPKMEGAPSGLEPSSLCLKEQPVLTCPRAHGGLKSEPFRCLCTKEAWVVSFLLELPGPLKPPGGSELARMLFVMEKVPLEPGEEGTLSCFTVSFRSAWGIV